MKKIAWTLLVSVAVFALVAILARPTVAQSSGSNMVQGIAGNGSSAGTIRPLLTGVTNGTNVYSLQGDTSGNSYVSLRSGTTALVDANGLKVQGPAATAAAPAGNAVFVAGLDNNSVVRPIPVSENTGAYAGGAGTYSLMIGGSSGAVARVLGVQAGGSAFTATGNTLIVGGSDNTNARSLNVTATGAAVTANPNVLLVGGQDSSGNCAPIRMGNTTTVHVPGDVFRTRVVNAPEWIGTQANGWNSAATGAGGTSTAVDCVGFATISIFGHTSGATTFTVQASQDNSNFYDTGTTNAPAGAADFGFTFSTGSRYVRIKSSNNVTATLTVAGKN